MPEVDLRSAARASNRFFGAAVQIEQLRNDSLFRRTVINQCDSLTPELALKWEVIEPAQGAFNFAPMDELADFARDNGKRLYGHTLLWYRSIPAWARTPINTPRGWDMIHRGFAETMPRYNDIVDYWDVVNEPLDSTQDDGLRRSPFYEAFGPDYIRHALNSARHLAPQGKLLINDYGVEYSGPDEHARRKALLALIDKLRQQRVPLDGVGIQSHLDLHRGPIDQQSLATFLKELADRGLLILITELDVREVDITMPLALRDQKVAEGARAFLDVALAQPAVRGVTTWGLSDRYSWINVDADTGRVHTGRNRGLPFDVDMKPKPFCYSAVEAFRNGSPAPPRSNHKS